MRRGRFTRARVFLHVNHDEADIDSKSEAWTLKKTIQTKERVTVRKIVTASTGMKTDLMGLNERTSQAMAKRLITANLARSMNKNNRVDPSDPISLAWAALHQLLS
jgi:hypothetical protein